jgi:hypothetical protein
MFDHACSAGSSSRSGRMPAVLASRTALEAAGLPEAAASPAGQLATAGYRVTPLHAVGPDRAAVHWCAPSSPAGPPEPDGGLGRCQEALCAAGCRCELVITAGGGYLAVLAPEDGRPSPVPHAPYAVSVSIDDLALILGHVHATRLGGPRAQPAAQAAGDAAFAYRRLKDAITSRTSTRRPSDA